MFGTYTGHMHGVRARKSFHVINNKRISNINKNEV